MGHLWCPGEGTQGCRFSGAVKYKRKGRGEGRERALVLLAGWCGDVGSERRLCFGFYSWSRAGVEAALAPCAFSCGAGQGFCAFLLSQLSPALHALPRLQTGWSVHTFQTEKQRKMQALSPKELEVILGVIHKAEKLDVVEQQRIGYGPVLVPFPPQERAAPTGEPVSAA